MKIAVMGAGGVGGCLGALLAQSGNEVWLIARWPHLDAIRDNGLSLRGQGEDFTVAANATDDPHYVGTADLVLFTVKTYHNPVTIPLLQPLVGPDTAILTMQNGVESHEQIGAVLGREHVLPGAYWASAYVESPGVIIEAIKSRVSFGEIDTRESRRVQDIQRVFQEARVVTEISADTMQVLWTKFVPLSAVAGVTSASRTLIKRLAQIPEARQTYIAALDEICAVARARQVNIAPNLGEEMVAFIDSLPDDYQNSMHLDLENGRPLELEALNGAVVRMGREAGVPTPVNSLLYSLLLPHKDGSAAN